MISAILKIIKPATAIAGTYQQEKTTASILLHSAPEKQKNNDQPAVTNNTKKPATTYRFNSFAGPHCYF